MSWFKVDDAMPTHRKVLSIPRGTRRLTAVGAWALCGAWVSANGNDGHLPRHVLDDFGIPPKIAADLVTAGLWEQAEDGYQIHDYLDYNPSGEQVAADRAAAAERQRRAREKAKASRRDSRVTHTEVTGRDSHTRHGPPDPTRPGTTTTSVAALPDRFDEFWAIYPRRVAKGQAVKAWKVAVRKADSATIIEGASSFAASVVGKDPAYIPHASTWLNAERWADEPQLQSTGSRGSWDV